MPTVCVFGSSSPRTNPAFLRAAADLGTALAKAGIVVRNGAGKDGCMGAINDAVFAAGGQAEGVILRQFLDEGLQHGGLKGVLVADTMRERKRLLGEGVDAFIAVPGGPGTWEELWEVAVERQIGVHHAPMILLDVGGFYRPFADILTRAASDGLLYGEPEVLVQITDKIDQAVAWSLNGVNTDGSRAGGGA